MGEAGPSVKQAKFAPESSTYARRTPGDDDAGHGVLLACGLEAEGKGAFWRPVAVSVVPDQ